MNSAARFFGFLLVSLLFQQTNDKHTVAGLEGMDFTESYKNHIKDGWNFFSFNKKNEASIGYRKNINGKEVACFDNQLGAYFEYEKCVSTRNEHLVGTGRAKHDEQKLDIPLYFDIGDDEFIIRSISECAFMNFINLQEIAIPSSVSSIGRSSFRGCRNLAKIIYRGNQLLDSEQSDSIFEGTPSSLVVQVSLTYESSKFLKRSVHRAKLLENTVTGTEEHPIYTGTGELTSTMTDFSNKWEKIKAVTIKGYSSVGVNTFYTNNENAAVLAEINLGATITVLKVKAFRGAAIEYIKLPMALTELESSVFNHCMKLKRVIFLGNVTSIGTYQFAFSPLNNLSYCGLSGISGNDIGKDSNFVSGFKVSVTSRYSGSGTFLNKNTIEGLSLKPVIEDGDISYQIFEHEITVTCTNNALITKTSFEKALLGQMRCGCNDYDEFFSLNINGQCSIDANTFSLATSLTSVNFGTELTGIGASAFTDTKISTIELPTTCTAVGNDCFKNAMSLATATFKGPIAFGSSVFVGTTLSTVTFESTGSYSFGASCFKDLTKITTLSFSSSVSMGESSFSGCTGITSISLAAKATTLGASCLLGCTGITSLTFLGETTISGSTFSGCSKLKSLIFKNKGTFNGNNILSGCTAFEYIKYCSTIEPVISDTGDIFGLSKEFKIYVNHELTVTKFGDKKVSLRVLDENCAFVMTSKFTVSSDFKESVRFSVSQKFTGTSIFKQTGGFTLTSEFSISHIFAETSSFTQSGGSKKVYSPTEIFTLSLDFKQTKVFKETNYFSDSIRFAQSEKFSLTKDFMNTKQFSLSSDFKLSKQFSSSSIFIKSNDFSHSAIFIQSRKFSLTKDFVKTKDFSTSSGFKESARFSNSDKFVRTYDFSLSSDFKLSKQFSLSNIFRKTNKFSDSTRFGQSEKFSLTKKFINTKHFSLSSDFKLSNQFSYSGAFIKTNDFSHSAIFIQSGKFSLTKDFVKTKDFSTSNGFKESTHFSNSDNFLKTKELSLSNDFKESKKFSSSNVYTESYLFGHSVKFSYSEFLKRSNVFSISKEFLRTNKFSRSKLLKNTNKFTTSKIFSVSSEFENSIEYSMSSNFIKSEKFSESPQPSANLETSIDTNPKKEQASSFHLVDQTNEATSVEHTIISKIEPSSEKEKTIDQKSNQEYFTSFIQEGVSKQETIVEHATSTCKHIKTEYESSFIQNTQIEYGTLTNHELTTIVKKPDEPKTSNHFTEAQATHTKQRTEIESNTLINLYETSGQSNESFDMSNSTENIVIDQPSENQENAKLQSGAIAGIVIGVIVLIAIIVILVFIILRKSFAGDSQDSWSNASFDQEEGVSADVSQFPVAYENTTTEFDFNANVSFDESDNYTYEYEETNNLIIDYGS